MRVVLVEDNPVNSYMARFLLERAGHTIAAECDNGAEALETAQALRPDLILLDINLAGPMDGREVAQRLRANEITRDITIVAFTALAMKGDRERILASGCDGYVSKPIDPATFVQQLEACHEQ